MHAFRTQLCFGQTKINLVGSSLDAIQIELYVYHREITNLREESERTKMRYDDHYKGLSHTALLFVSSREENIVKA